MIRMHFARLFRTRRFWEAIIGVCAISLLSIMGEIQAFSRVSLYYLVISRHGIGAFFIAMSVIIVFPNALSYSYDVRNHYDYEIFGRCKRKNYCWANVLVTASSAFMTVFFGYLLLYGLLKIRYPLILPEEAEQLMAYSQLDGGLTPYEKLLLGKYPILYFLNTFATEAMGYSFLSCVTLAVSAKIKSPFILLSIPLMVYFGSQYLANVLQLPWFFRWDNIMSHGGYFAFLTDDPIRVLAGVFVYFAVLIIICGFIFTRLVRRIE